jgi:hypothetical protein
MDEEKHCPLMGINTTYAIQNTNFTALHINRYLRNNRTHTSMVYVFCGKFSDGKYCPNFYLADLTYPVESTSYVTQNFTLSQFLIIKEPLLRQNYIFVSKAFYGRDIALISILWVDHQNLGLVEGPLLVQSQPYITTGILPIDVLQCRVSFSLNLSYLECAAAAALS